MNKEDFEYIIYPDSTCGICLERAPGVVLAYDEFSPEGATWFCAECWPYFEELEELSLLVIVEDKRIERGMR